MNVRPLIVAALLLVACCGTTPTRIAPGGPIRLEITQVPLDPGNPDVQSIGAFTYSGGIEIKAAVSATVLELSDLRVSNDRMVTVSDSGYFLEARLVFDANDRLSGLADARVIPLLGERGEPLTGTDADAEGVDVLPDGTRLVSFEGNHRIWRYRADGTPLGPAPKPDAAFPSNEGMEALALYPASGADAYLVGSEGGAVWLCRLSSTCTDTSFGALVPPGFSLSALAPYGEAGGFALLGRSYDPARGVRIAVRLIVTEAPAPRVLDEMTMAPPLSVDNFEGIAAVPRSNGGIRLYLLADDNGSATQHTYLLAFDWQPAR
jgi:hypothetical protein